MEFSGIQQFLRNLNVDLSDFNVAWFLDADGILLDPTTEPYLQSLRLHFFLVLMFHVNVDRSSWPILQVASFQWLCFCHMIGWSCICMTGQTYRYTNRPNTKVECLIYMKKFCFVGFWNNLPYKLSRLISKVKANGFLQYFSSSKITFLFYLQTFFIWVKCLTSVKTLIVLYLDFSDLFFYYYLCFDSHTEESWSMGQDQSNTKARMFSRA